MKQLKRFKSEHGNIVFDEAGPYIKYVDHMDIVLGLRAEIAQLSKIEQSDISLDTIPTEPAPAEEEPPLEIKPEFPTDKPWWKK